MGDIVGRLVFVSILFLVPTAAFWALVPLGRHSDAFSGPLAERAYYFAVTASGPFALIAMGYGLLPGLPIGCAIVSLLLAAAILGRDVLATRLLGYLAIVVWFVFGAVSTSLRFAV